MNLDDRLDQALHDFRDADIPDGPPPEVLSQTLAALRLIDGAKPPHSSHLLNRMGTMPSFARIAAGLLIAAGSIGLLSLLTPDRKGPGVAFADVLKQVQAARTMSYTMRFGDDPTPYRVSRMEPGLTRTELPGGGVTIMDRTTGKNLVLNSTGKLAIFFENKSGSPAGIGADLIDQLRDFRGKPDKDLGEKVFNGRAARGFRIEAGGWSPVVWVDVKTNLPIRMETKINAVSVGAKPVPTAAAPAAPTKVATTFNPAAVKPAQPEGAKPVPAVVAPPAAPSPAVKSIFNTDGTMTVVYDDFVFDARLDKSLFSMTPPEGYTTQAIPLPVVKAAPAEKDLVDLLGEYAKLSGGRFPNDLQVTSLMDVMKDIKVTKAGLDDTTNAWIAKVGPGIGLIWAMPPDSDVLYTGKDVKSGQADKPIFRYRPQGSKTYRVIYADLTVKDVEPSQIPK